MERAGRDKLFAIGFRYSCTWSLDGVRGDGRWEVGAVYVTASFELRLPDGFCGRAGQGKVSHDHS